MPDPSERKTRKKSLDRVKKKYIECPDSQNPMNLYPALAKDTDAIRALMNTKNYLRLLTQLDRNQFVLHQHYLYCDNDMWMCGDALIMNVNPDKKIYARVLCSKTKVDCVCYDEYSKHFISICPQCGAVVDMIKSTPFECEHCKYVMSWKNVDDMPFAKIPCEWCPREIGWDKTQQLRDMVRGRLQLRAHVVKRKMDEDFAEMEKEARS